MSNDIIWAKRGPGVLRNTAQLETAFWKEVAEIEKTGIWGLVYESSSRTGRHQDRAYLRKGSGLAGLEAWGEDKIIRLHFGILHVHDNQLVTKPAYAGKLIGAAGTKVKALGQVLGLRFIQVLEADRGQEEAYQAWSNRYGIYVWVGTKDWFVCPVCQQKLDEHLSLPIGPIEWEEIEEGISPTAKLISQSGQFPQIQDAVLDLMIRTESIN